MTGKYWLKPDHLGRLFLVDYRLFFPSSVGALTNHSNKGLLHGQGIRWSCSTATEI